MSDRNKDIKALKRQLDHMARIIDNLTTKDPEITFRSPVLIFTPSREEAERYPPIFPADSLSFYTDISEDDDAHEYLNHYPKNPKMGYEPPTVPAAVFKQLSQEQLTHDMQLRSIQQHIANMTGPVDNLIS
ncbi:hypothetical protein BGW41_002889 [Actinomortierella wolfii]|nr:hypothetical protein BGW41_002889 [Actinomortierella wolfii]